MSSAATPWKLPFYVGSEISGNDMHAIVVDDEGRRVPLCDVVQLLNAPCDGSCAELLESYIESHANSIDGACPCELCSEAADRLARLARRATGEP